LILLVGVLPILLVGVLVGYILLKFLPDNNATLPVVLRFAPDAGILILGIMLIASAWIAANLIFLWLAAKSGGSPEAAL
jgi:hypothetical protein